LRPNDAATFIATGHLLLNAGQWTQAAARMERARASDPRQASTHAHLALVLMGLRRYADTQHAIERSLALEPDQLLAYISQIWTTWLWKGDLDASRQLVDRLPVSDDWRFMELRFLQALYERRYDAAVQAQAGWSGRWMRTYILTRPVVLMEAQAWRLAGHRTRAAASFEAARRLLDAELRTTPEDGRLRSSLAIALAGLGLHDEAIHEARQAVARMPFPQAFDATAVREDAALALTMAGAHDAALDQLDILLSHPAHFSAQLLRLDPRWDPLRHQPRYHALLARAHDAP
jgi:tetratricopeptide (TPR) repeat protein